MPRDVPEIKRQGDTDAALATLTGTGLTRRATEAQLTAQLEAIKQRREATKTAGKLGEMRLQKDIELAKFQQQGAMDRLKTQQEGAMQLQEQGAQLEQSRLKDYQGFISKERQASEAHQLERDRQQNQFALDQFHRAGRVGPKHRHPDTAGRRRVRPPRQAAAIPFLVSG
ncbi:MAG: hypothetical protein ACYTAF_13830 [Planctomycetota bacterium]|jgi:hypothetical protein